MSIHDQQTAPIASLSSQTINYVRLKQLSDRSGVRLLHLYRLSRGQRVRGLNAPQLDGVVSALAAALAGGVPEGRR